VGFEILGVVDLRRGLAVHARGGQREGYEPIAHVAGAIIEPGNAAALARQYVERFGVSALYVADLDAIDRRQPQHTLIRAMASVGAPIWLDGGIASLADAHRALSYGASRLVVGLETLPSLAVLQSIVQDVGRERVVFSLDLRDAKPLAAASELAEQRPEDLVARATDAGVSTVIVLDLARVGSGSGVDLEMLERIRSRVPAVRVYAGGGLRSIDDIGELHRAGCDGALVASALLGGRITAHDLNLYLRACT
jgi:phosphoribosylformimino-5-aminoimidazole carboxamide ribotide isomerase